MTLTPTLQRNTVSATGFSNPLNLPANAEVASHVKVYGDDMLLVNGVDYMLAGIGDIGDLDEIAGVNAIIDAGVLLDDMFNTYTIVHDPPMDQEVDMSSGGRLGIVYEAALDAIMRRVQAFRSLFDRTPRLPPDVTGFDPTLPFPVPRRAVIWNETGTGFTNSASDPDTEPLTSAIAQANAAAASASAAAASATTAGTQASNAAASAAAAQIAAGQAGDLSALLNYLVPVGAYILFAGAAAPTNYLACQGQAVSRTTYAALFAVVGTTYGVGNGTTTFNLPKFDDGRFMRPTGGNAAARGVDQAEMIGPHGHDATVANAGAHTHTYSAQSRYGANSDPASVFRPSAGDSNGGTPTLTTTSNGDHTHTATVAPNTGTENRPRNSSVLVCIKY